MTRSKSESSRSRGNIDRLSSLPDSLLHNIISFIPARQSVQMCMLSKRWKTLWTTLPVLNCCSNERLSHRNWQMYSARVKSLVKFVSMVLLHRDATSHLHTFSIDCGCDCHGHCFCGCGCGYIKLVIRSWIQYAIQYNLRVLTINIKIRKTIIYPAEVFICPSLVQVTLPHMRHIDCPKIINLPSFKQLHLKNAELNQDFMSNLLYGCPVLEGLHVEGGSVEVSDITSHSLKQLKIMTELHQGLIKLINCPNLLSFHFATCYCCQTEGISLNMASLSEACIEFAICSYELDQTKSSNILYGLFNVHRLELNGNFFFVQDYLEAEISNCRTFSNLTCLSVCHLCLICHIDLLSSLLEHCPNLKKLSLVHYDCPIEYCWVPCKRSKQKKVAQFKCDQLETVELKFSMEEKTFYRAVKCLQEAVSKLRNCRIIMTNDACFYYGY